MVIFFHTLVVFFQGIADLEELITVMCRGSIYIQIEIAAGQHLVAGADLIALIQDLAQVTLIRLEAC
jgi:hypothetical protein